MKTKIFAIFISFLFFAVACENDDTNKSQIFELFKHEKLKGKKTIVKKEPAFTIIDDTNGEEATTVLVDDIDSPTGEALVEVVEEIEEVSTPGTTQTLTDMDDATEEAQAEPVEPDNQDNTWL